MKPHNATDACREAQASDHVLFEDRGYDDTMIAFAGIAGEAGLPQFEWKKLTSQIRLNVIFIRDPSQSWYQQHLFKAGTNFKCLLRDAGAIDLWERSDRKFAIGNSMGGFAAIVSAASLGAHRVVAFSPQTFVDPVRRLIHRDRRWSQPVQRMYRQFGLFRSSYDAVELLKKQNDLPRVSIFIGKNANLDALHAQRLSRFGGVKISSIEDAGHDAVSKLKESGRLLELLSREFGDVAPKAHRGTDQNVF